MSAERKPAGARVSWYGTLNFGLVSVPVGLCVAQSRQEPGFKQLHKGCGRPIKQLKTCEEHGVLTADTIDKGYEYAKGEFVVVDEGDLDALDPVGSKSITILRFVPADSVDPIYHDRTYYLSPSEEEAERVGYRLLLEAMKETNRAAVARFVLWGKEHLCTVRPSPGEEDVMVLDTLFYYEDVRDPAPLSGRLASVQTSAGELSMAKQLIAGLSEDVYDPTQYRSEHRERVRGMLDSLVAGKKPTKGKAPRQRKAPKDIQDALRASITQVEKDKKASRPKSTPRGRAVQAKAASARTRGGRKK